MTKSKEAGAVAVQEEVKNGALVVPDYMKSYAGAGTENIGMDDMEIPRLKLLQAISDEVQEREDCRVGEYFHTIAEMSLGRTLKVVPIYIFKSAILWRPRHDGGGILARADDGTHWNPPNAEFTVKPAKDNSRTVTWKTAPTVEQSRLLEWGSYDPENQNSPPAATRMINIVAFLPDFPDLSPCVITLQRSSIKVGRKFLSKLKLIQAPSFGLYFEMGSIKDTNANNQDFWNYKFDAAGYVQDMDEFKNYVALYERFKAEGVKIKDIDGLQDEDSGPGGDDADDGKDGRHQM
jgi:hypothetical protein